MPIPGAPTDSPNPLGDLFGGVNRPQLNAFVANSQARNGLVSAQTQEAMIKASQAQEQQQAWDDLQSALIANGAKPSQAALVRAATVAANNHDPETAMKVMQAAGLQWGDPSTQVGAQQGAQGHIAGPVAEPNNYMMPAAPPGGSALGTPQQSVQGAAQTKQTKAITANDVADAELRHQQAKNAINAGQTTLSPAGLDMCAQTVMADPSKMASCAGYGASGQKNKDAINNAIAQKLSDAGMTPDDMIQHRALTKASVSSAAQGAKQLQTLDAFMPLVKGNGDRITQLLDQLDASGGAGIDEPIVNGMERMLGRKLNSDDLTELHSVFTTYQMDIARLLASGPSMNGVISDRARGEVESMAPENMSSSGARRVISRVSTELGLRRDGTQNSINEAANAQLPVVHGHQPGNAPAAPGAADADLPPGWHRAN